MKRALSTGVVALIGVMMVGDFAEGRIFGRRRGYSNNCSTCNTCAPQGQQYYDPNMGPGNAPPPAPNAQYQQGNTYYRGQPQLAPNQQGTFQGNANLQGGANAGAPQGNVNLQGGANLGGRQGQAGANIQGRTNLNAPQGNANLRSNTGANANQGGAAAGANAAGNVDTNP